MLSTVELGPPLQVQEELNCLARLSVAIWFKMLLGLMELSS